MSGRVKPKNTKSAPAVEPVATVVAAATATVEPQPVNIRSSKPIVEQPQPDQNPDAANGAPGDRSPEMTLAKQEFIINYLKKHGDTTLTDLMEKVKAEFGSMIAFAKASQAKKAWHNKQTLQMRDGRRQRALQDDIPTIADSKIFIGIQDGDALKDVHICADQKEAAQYATVLLGKGEKNVVALMRVHLNMSVTL